MAALYLVIGGIGGGLLGWLIDRRTNRTKAKIGNQAAEVCETST